ncbi:MAG: hypothetical protein AMXMBFR59_40060 [Rhodanobacteraceae bacterium]
MTPFLIAQRSSKPPSPKITATTPNSRNYEESKMNWNEVKEQVEANGNVRTFTMDVLRNAIGAGKLGVNVRAEISQMLAGIGLGHIPVELPSYQHEQVRLYKRGTPIGQLIETVLLPGEQNDLILAERFGSQGPNYAAIVQKIRELVAE